LVSSMCARGFTPKRQCQPHPLSLEQDMVEEKYFGNVWSWVRGRHGRREILWKCLELGKRKTWQKRKTLETNRMKTSTPQTVIISLACDGRVLPRALQFPKSRSIVSTVLLKCSSSNALRFLKVLAEMHSMSTRKKSKLHQPTSHPCS